MQRLAGNGKYRSSSLLGQGEPRSCFILSCCDWIRLPSMKLKASCLGLEGREYVSCICPLPAVSFLSCSVRLWSLLQFIFPVQPYWCCGALPRHGYAGPRLLSVSSALVKRKLNRQRMHVLSFLVFGFPVKLPCSSGIGRDSIPE